MQRHAWACGVKTCKLHHMSPNAFPQLSLILVVNMSIWLWLVALMQETTVAFQIAGLRYGVSLNTTPFHSIGPSAMILQRRLGEQQKFATLKFSLILKMLPNLQSHEVKVGLYIYGTRMIGTCTVVRPPVLSLQAFQLNESGNSRCRIGI